MRILDAIALENNGTYEVCSTATLQEDSQGRDKDGESVKGVRRTKKGRGERRDIQDLDSHDVSTEKAGGKTQGNTYFADVRAGERHY